jgi:hypothetical protein
MVSPRRNGPGRRLVRISLLGLLPAFTLRSVAFVAPPASAATGVPSVGSTLTTVETLVSAALCDVNKIITGDIGPGTGPCGFPGLG